jgi:hypothetical protein
MTRARLTCALLLASGCASYASGCSKGSTGETPPSSSSASASASATGSAPATGSAAASPGAPVATAARPTGPMGWKGGYKSAPGVIVLPKDVSWKIPETTAGVGEGTIALTVDPATGRLQGKIDGVLGPATMDGLASDGKIAATISRADPADHGFTGTLTGDLGDASARGTMNLALADVSAVRSATFELSPVR